MALPDTAEETWLRTIPSGIRLEWARSAVANRSEKLGSNADAAAATRLAVEDDDDDDDDDAFGRVVVVSNR